MKKISQKALSSSENKRLLERCRYSSALFTKPTTTFEKADTEYDNDVIYLQVTHGLTI